MTMHMGAACVDGQSSHQRVGLMRGCGSRGRRVAVLGGGMSGLFCRSCRRRGGLGWKLGQIPEDVIQDKVPLLLDSQEKGLHEAPLVLVLHPSNDPEHNFTRIYREWPQHPEDTWLLQVGL